MSQQTYHNIHNRQLHTSRAEVPSSASADYVRSAQPDQDVQDFTEYLAMQALAGRNLFWLDLNLGSCQIKMLLTVVPPQVACTKNNGQPTIYPYQHATGSVECNMINPNNSMQAEDIYDSVAQALHDYHFACRLARNPLATLFNLTPCSTAENQDLHSSGEALRQLVDQAIDAISGLSPSATVEPDAWRLEQYLHLRYRKGIQHKELATWMGYTERHLLRLRKELILEAAELMIQHYR